MTILLFTFVFLTGESEPKKRVDRFFFVIVLKTG